MVFNIKLIPKSFYNILKKCESTVFGDKRTRAPKPGPHAVTHRKHEYEN